MVAVSNAPERGIARDEPGKRAAEAVPTPAAAAVVRRRQHGELRIYQHSNLLYWWPIWAYGFLCAALTYVQGIGVEELAADRRARWCCFIPSPWLGISFIALILFVAVFTNVRARGVYSFMLILIAGGLFWLRSEDTWRRYGVRLALLAACSSQSRVLSDVLHPSDVHLAVRHRLRRSFHLVAVLAGTSHRGAPDRSGDRPRLQHRGHGGPAACRTISSGTASSASASSGWGPATSLSSRPTRTRSRSTMFGGPAASSGIWSR